MNKTTLLVVLNFLIFWVAVSWSAVTPNTPEMKFHVSREYVKSPLDAHVVIVTIQSENAVPQVIGVTRQAPAGHSASGVVSRGLADIVLGSGFVQQFVPPAPVGLLIVDGEQISAINPKGFDTIIAITTDRLRLVAKDDFNDKGVTGAIQTGPWLVRDGKTSQVETKGARSATRSFVCEMKNGELVLGITEDPVFLYDLARYLASSEVSCLNATNLAGGGSEALVFKNKEGRQMYGNARLRQASLIAFSTRRPAITEDELLWQKIQNTSNPGDLKSFLENFPDSVYAPLARKRLEKIQVVPPATDQVPEDERVWRVVQNSDNPGDFEFFVKQYPDSLFAPFARNRLEETRKETAGETVVAVGVFPKQPGHTFKDCADCPQMVVIPPGRFRMGDLSGRGDDDEKPVHAVTIGYKFAVGKYEVTFDEWKACVADGGCNGHRPDDRGWGRGRRPVIDVSWDDAKAYVRWLSGKTRQEYRLLSEAEWEYVARAGTTTAYFNGPSIAKGQARYASPDGTVRVGSYSPNAFGVFDTLGNVWEWAEDCWHDGYHGAPGNGGAWTTGGECDKRVLRGGSWISYPRDLRSALRFWDSSGRRYSSLGFRVARTL